MRPESQRVEQWSKKRIDYLWVELENQDSKPQRGQIVLKIDSDKLLHVDQDMQHVDYVEQERPFCTVSPKCVLFSPKSSEEGKPVKRSVFGLGGCLL